MPSMRITAAGYGAGTLDPLGFPNVCRVVIGFATPTVGERTEPPTAESQTSFESELIAVLEANLDDSSPQLLAFAMEQLFQAGALDVTVTPVVMKKSRSGHVLSVICAPSERLKLEEIMLRQTSTLGVRSHICERLVARREWQQVSLGKGDTVRVKLGRDNDGNIVNAQPEYEDCAAYANKHGVPLKQVIAKALANLKGDS
jgi:pyridinium-3,5-bisthiocarboxylic acid mononucleotide nickel chelatase